MIDLDQSPQRRREDAVNIEVDCEFDRPYSQVLDILRESGLRPTRQRLALAKVLFGCGNRHITAEQLHAETMQADMKVSLATIYNTLHQFTEVGLLRVIVVDPGRAYFDTNTTPHHHFFYEKSGIVMDIPGDDISVAHLKAPTEGRIRSIDVVVRIAE
jgi:Fur family iron response transcriptional regulator